MEKYPSFFGFSVSHTTRGPRPGEANGIQYNFVTVDEMKQAIQQGKFIEYAQVHTNYYGTSYAAVERIQSSGKICILDIDIQGVQNVKKSQLDCHYLFITPPSLAELESRLRGRGTETEEKIRIRTENAKKELEYGLQEGNFNAVIVNDTVESAIIRALSYVEEWYKEYGFRIHDEDLPRGEGKRAEGKDDDEEEEEEEEK
jgi:guanylate kinase